MAPASAISIVVESEGATPRRGRLHVEMTSPPRAIKQGKGLGGRPAGVGSDGKKEKVGTEALRKTEATEP